MKPKCCTIYSMGENESKLGGEWGNTEVENELKPLFRLGQVVGTPGALIALENAEQSPVELLLRHVTAIGET